MIVSMRWLKKSMTFFQIQLNIFINVKETQNIYLSFGAIIYLLLLILLCLFIIFQFYYYIKLKDVKHTDLIDEVIELGSNEILSKMYVNIDDLPDVIKDVLDRKY